MSKKIQSQNYYWTGPKKNFPTQNAAQRQAEWFCKHYIISSKYKVLKSEIIWGSNWVRAEIEFDEVEA